MAITRAQQARQMYKKGSKEPVKQAGVMNYMPSEMVTVPKIAKSSPDTPTAKLAYITPEEQDVLIDLNLYGSLDGKPNRGPGGIPSLEGDFGSPTGQAGTGAGSGGSYGEAGADVSGRTDTGTGNYQVTDQKAQKEYEANRRKREADAKQKAIEEKFKADAKRTRKEMRSKIAADNKTRRDRINNILLKNKNYLDPRTGQIVDLSNYGVTGTELEDLKALGFENEEDRTDLQQSILDQAYEKSDRFSGANLSNFQNKQMEKAGFTSPLIALLQGSGLAQKGMTKNREFFSDPNYTGFFGRDRNSVLDAGKYTFDGNPITQEQFAMLSPAEMEMVYKDYSDRRRAGEIDAIGNPTIPTGVGRDDPVSDPCKGPNPPAYCFVNQDPTTPDPTPTRNLGGLAPRFAGSIFDFTGLADGGRVAAMGGGIMNTDVMGGMADGNIDEAGRQMYFLGKLVKKATRAVKKVVKSPIGKAALGAALTFGIPGTSFGGLMGKAGGLSGLKAKLFGEFGGTSRMTEGILGKLGLTGGGGAMMPTLKGGLALGFGVPLALDMLGVGKDDDDKMDLDAYYKSQGINVADIRMNPYNYLAPRFAADGGLMRTGYQEGGDAEPVAKKTMPLLDMDGQEKDYRETGGFVDMGRMERADDVPARLSKNEFVFTADAVRNAGEGDIDKGAEVMYNMMKNLESGGEVSEESQGLDGAREMFQTSQRLEEVL